MWVFTIDIIHQFLVLRFVYNSNDLIALFHIVGADRLIDRSAAVQVIDDKWRSSSSFLLIMQTRRFTLWLKINDPG